MVHAGDSRVRARLLLNDQTDVAAADTVLWQGGPEAIAAGTTGHTLMIFTVPRAAVESEMLVSLGYVPVGSTPFEISAVVAPFDLR
jgi:hypothetical protein